MMLSGLLSENSTRSMFRSRSDPSRLSSVVSVTITCPSAVAEKAYSERRPWNLAVSMSPAVVSILISRMICSWPGLIAPSNIQVLSGLVVGTPAIVRPERNRAFHAPDVLRLTTDKRYLRSRRTIVIEAVP